jgi:hypothetical protein
LDKGLAHRRVQRQEPDPLVQRRLRLLPFRDVPEDQHAAKDVALVVPDRGGTVVNRALRAVFGDEDGVVRQTNDLALPQRPQGRVLHRLPGRLVDDHEDLLQRCALRLPLPPAGQLLGYIVEEGDPTFGVGGDDTITDAG